MIPSLYQYQNAMVSPVNPNTVHLVNTFLYRYHQRYLLQRILGIFDFEIPENWNSQFFKYVLFCDGHITGVRTDVLGLICQNSTLAGMGVYYEPTHVQISNPILVNLQTRLLKIGVEVENIRLMPDWGGVMDIVNEYAQQLALISQCMSINVLNCHTPFIFPCENDRQSNTIKEMYDRVASGEPEVVISKDILNDDGSWSWEPFCKDVKNIFISNDLAQLYRTTMAEFDSTVGISNVNYEKKERLLTDEVNANNEETQVLSDVWLSNLKESIDSFNDFFGAEYVSVKKHFDGKGAEIDASKTILDGAL